MLGLARQGRRHANTTKSVSAFRVAVAIISQCDSATEWRRARRNVTLPYLYRGRAGISPGNFGSRRSQGQIGITRPFAARLLDPGGILGPVSLAARPSGSSAAAELLVIASGGRTEDEMKVIPPMPSKD